MAFLAQLWLPVLLSAALVFVLSAAAHMATPWRRREWGRLDQLDALQAALRSLPPGQYSFPAPPDPKQGMTKEWLERWEKGPSGWVTLAAPGPVSMGRNMALTLVAYLVVAILVAYVGSLGLGPSPTAWNVLRITSPVGFMALGIATVFNSIWYARPWSAWVMDAGEALVFAFAMAGVFAWLWPR